MCYEDVPHFVSVNYGKNQRPDWYQKLDAENKTI